MREGLVRSFGESGEDWGWLLGCECFGGGAVDEGFGEEWGGDKGGWLCLWHDVEVLCVLIVWG